MRIGYLAYQHVLKATLTGLLDDAGNVKCPCSWIGHVDYLLLDLGNVEDGSVDFSCTETRNIQ